MTTTPTDTPTPTVIQIDEARAEHEARAEAARRVLPGDLRPYAPVPDAQALSDECEKLIRLAKDHAWWYGLSEEKETHVAIWACARVHARRAEVEAMRAPWLHSALNRTLEAFALSVPGFPAFWMVRASMDGPGWRMIVDGMEEHLAKQQLAG